jgi:hypothetical protein
LLRREGIAGDLRIGARKVDGKLDAHAWVELNGRAIDDGDDAPRRFVPFETGPSVPSAGPLGEPPVGREAR